MKYYLLVTFLVICRPSLAQEKPYARFSLTAQTGFSRMTGLPGNIDQQPSSGSGIHLQYNLQLGVKKIPFYLTTGLGYERYRYLSDGIFTQTNEGHFFVRTPDSYKQQETAMQFLQVPLLFRIVPFRESATSIGVYGNYLLDAKSKYKIGVDKLSAEAVIENKFQLGIAFDQEFIILRDKQKKAAPVVGFGLNYQLTGFLRDERSFKPLMGYLKIGVVLW